MAAKRETVVSLCEKCVKDCRAAGLFAPCRDEFPQGQIARLKELKKFEDANVTLTPTELGELKTLKNEALQYPDRIPTADGNIKWIRGICKKAADLMRIEPEIEKPGREYVTLDPNKIAVTLDAQNDDMTVWNTPSSLGMPTLEEFNALEKFVVRALRTAKGKAVKGKKNLPTPQIQNDRLLVFVSYLSCLQGAEIAYVHQMTQSMVYNHLTSTINVLGKYLLKYTKKKAEKTISFRRSNLSNTEWIMPALQTIKGIEERVEYFNGFFLLKPLLSRITKAKIVEKVRNKWKTYVLHSPDGSSSLVQRSSQTGNLQDPRTGAPVVKDGWIKVSYDDKTDDLIKKYEVKNGLITHVHELIKPSATMVTKVKDVTIDGKLMRMPIKVAVSPVSAWNVSEWTQKKGTKLAKNLDTVEFKKLWLGSLYFVEDGGSNE